MNNKLTVVTINRSDNRGGAATVAWNLFTQFQTMGIESWYFVQYKFSNHPKVITVDNDRYAGLWSISIAVVQKFLLNYASWIKGVWRFTNLLDWIAKPGVMFRHQLGIEEFGFKGSRQLLRRIPVKPDIIHAHVLHGGFFDLRYIGKLSWEIPVFLTLHDAWLLAGHCAHSFDCDRWKTGCGNCPDLTIPKSIKYDNSALNWRRKQKIYKNSRFYVAAPCEWLINKVKQSILAEAAIETRVIPYGVNHEVFFPSSRNEARKVLGLDQHAFIFLFSANGIRRNRWKDFEMMKKALEIVSKQKQQRRIIFLALGENAAPVFMENAEIQFVPFRSDPKSVADFYRAADVYLHASKADTFPNAVLEAISCGTPVIGTAVGGIPEQVKGLVEAGFLTSTHNRFSEHEATGVLVPSGDADSFATAMTLLIESDSLREKLGRNASADAFERFPLIKQTNAYLEWYREILNKRNEKKQPVGMA